MPTKTEREYYRMGFKDGQESAAYDFAYRPVRGGIDDPKQFPIRAAPSPRKPKRKRSLNSWQKFVKANSNKRKFRFKDGKLKLKSMGIAYRKTAAYKRSKK